MKLFLVKLLVSTLIILLFPAFMLFALAFSDGKGVRATVSAMWYSYKASFIDIWTEFDNECL